MPLPIFVISLDGSPRLGLLEQGLASQGLSHEVVLATDLRSATDDSLAAVANQRIARLIHGERLTGGQVGCVLSHRSAYQRFLETDAEWAVILEDDALIHPDFAGFIRKLEFAVTKDPTVVCMYAGLWVAQPLAREPLIDGVRLRTALFPPTGTVGYAINREAAAHALDASARVTSRADWPPWSLGVRFLVTQPQLVSHGLGESTLTSTSVADRSAKRRAPITARLFRLLLEPRGGLDLKEPGGSIPRMRYVVRSLVLPAAVRRVRRYLR